MQELNIFLINAICMLILNCSSFPHYTVISCYFSLSLLGRMVVFFSPKVLLVLFILNYHEVLQLKNIWKKHKLKPVTLNIQFIQSYKCDHCAIITLHFTVSFKGSLIIYKSLNIDTNPDICCTQLLSLGKFICET